jgi:hypothetical protein
MPGKSFKQIILETHGFTPVYKVVGGIVIRNGDQFSGLPDLLQPVIRLFFRHLLLTGKQSR